ncbi:MAG: hypothetical protein RI955_892 [Bacteroidota bacterium]|jgi:REP element-mobilizing transposase RayT
MSYIEHSTTKLEPSKFYHIYNRAVGDDLLFLNDENYRYFLKKYDEYLNEVIDTYAYCLMGNHFHLLIRVKDEIDLKHLTGFENLSGVLSKKFSNFFNAYTKAFNKVNQRNGTLFQTPFKRVLVNSDTYFTRLIYYIHNNPRHHEIMNDFTAYPWSSYGSLISENFSKLKRKEVIEWFYSKEEFVSFHKQKYNLIDIEQLIIE